MKYLCNGFVPTISVDTHFTMCDLCRRDNLFVLRLERAIIYQTFDKSIHSKMNLYIIMELVIFDWYNSYSYLSLRYVLLYSSATYLELVSVRFCKALHKTQKISMPIGKYHLLEYILSCLIHLWALVLAHHRHFAFHLLFPMTQHWPYHLAIVALGRLLQCS